MQHPTSGATPWNFEDFLERRQSVACAHLNLQHFWTVFLGHFTYEIQTNCISEVLQLLQSTSGATPAVFCVFWENRQVLHVALLHVAGGG